MHVAPLITLVSFFSALALAAVPVRAQSEAAPANVVDLRCEYLADPLGIDVREPRLSWRLEATDSDARGQRQSAFRVLVASDAERLARDEGDLWDSGQVESDQSVHVVYAGKPLAARARCYWKVRVRDEAGRESAW